MHYAAFKLHASVDGWGLFDVFLRFPGLYYKGDSLDSVFAYICITRSDWQTEPSLPEKLNFLTQATGPRQRMDPQCISRASHAKSMISVDDGGSVNAPLASIILCVSLGQF